MDWGRRVLILAPLGSDAELTAGFLSEAGLTTIICNTMECLVREAQSGCGALVIAEEALHDRSLGSFAAALAAQPSWSELPVCVIAAGRLPMQHSMRRLSAYTPHASITVLERPFHPETLVASVEAALRSRMRQYQVRDLLINVRQSKERLETTLGSISDAFASLDRQWRYTYANRAYLELISPIHGSAGALMGNSVWELFPDVVGSEIEHRYRRAMSTQQPDSFEIFYEPLQAWLELRVFPTPEILSIYVSDITSRKVTAQALSESEVRFRATFNQASTMIAILDADGIMKDINDSCLTSLKLQDKSEVGQPFWETTSWTGCPIVQANIRAAVEGAARGQSAHFETAFFTAEGEERWTDLCITPISDGNRLVFILAEGHDMTELREARRALEQARDVAVHASRAKDDFLASLSHELRTPLNPVLLVASEGATNPGLPEEVRRDFDSIRKNVNLEARLIDDLLDLTLITRGKMSLEMSAQDIHAILDDAIANVRTELAQKRLGLTMRFGANAPIWGDAVRLQQIFWNVLKNAVKFTPEGGHIRLETHIPAGASQMCVKISDNGIGMTPAELDRVFHSFMQGDHATLGGPHRFGGLGLGLAISRMLVEIHHGEIHATSEGPGKGTSFEICFPLAPPDQLPKIRPPIQAARPDPVRSANGPLRILLVEDHEPTRLTVERLLTRRHYQVACAATMGEARTIASRQSFDLVISDIGLPDGNGNDLMAELHRQHGLRGIAVTGYGMEEDIAQTRRSGFISHLTKPVTVQALETALTSAVELVR